MYRDTTAYISVRTYMYVPHLEFLANKGAEIEMSARSRFLGSRLGVLDRDASLENSLPAHFIARTQRGDLAFFPSDFQI